MREVIVASHRLPLKWDGEKVKRADGGLVSVLKDSGIEKKSIWFGCHAVGEPIFPTKKRLQRIPIHPEIHSEFYNGYCNGVLWPAFHDRLDLIECSEEKWHAYQAVNRKFARSIIEDTDPESPVWIHDYHLMLVPGLIKEAQPNRKVGFFLHIPWPRLEVATKVPYLERIVQKLCRADGLSFHSPLFEKQFQKFAYETVGLDVSAKTKSTPVGIDPARFSAGQVRALKSREVKKVIGVDRFDYSKGIDLKILAFHDFLEMNPQLRGTIEFHQLLIPTREQVGAYQNYQAEIQKLARYVNRKFGFEGWKPIHLNVGRMDHDELVRFYQKANVCFVGSHADGMNLVSMEFLSSQDSNDPGVLVLSDKTGASAYLKGCVQFQSSCVEDAVRGLFTALVMKEEERKERWRKDMNWIQFNTAQKYAHDNLISLGVEIEEGRSHEKPAQAAASHA